MISKFEDNNASSGSTTVEEMIEELETIPSSLEMAQEEIRRKGKQLIHFTQSFIKKRLSVFIQLTTEMSCLLCNLSVLI